MLLAGLMSGVSMCATDPPEAAVDPVEEGTQIGPDGLILRTSPTEAVEAGALPDALEATPEDS
jgi:hypothetical protein